MSSSELLANVALELVGNGSFDDRMNHALGLIGQHLGVSRTYIFLDRPGGQVTDNTHEWCARGISSQRDQLQGVDYAGIPSWKAMLQRDGRMLANDISRLAEDIRAALEPQGIKSILVLPLYFRNELSGFIGFDECISGRCWDVDDLAVLRTVSGIVSANLERDIDRKKLEKSEADFKLFFDAIDDLIVVADLAGSILYANGAVGRKLGFSPEELATMTLIDLHPEDSRDEARLIVDAMLRKERDNFVHPAQRNHAVHLMNEQGWIRNVEIQVKKKNGLIMSGLFSGGILSNQGKGFFLTVMVDITEQVELREYIESQRRKLRHIIDGTRLGTWEWNIRTGEIDINDRWAEMLGYTVEELKPTTIDTWQRLTFPDDLASSEKLLADHFSGTVEFYDSESRMRHKDGSEVWIHDQGKVTDRATDGSPLVMFGTHQDITRQKSREARIRDLSILDELTGMYNRRYILERLATLVEQYARNGQSFSVTMLDIDDFKKINDNYGHAAGDVILRDFAEIATSKIRPYDLIGRIGGEEFLLVSIDTSADKTASSIERIMVEARCRDYVHEGIVYRFTLSAGLADSNEFPRSETSAASLLALADRRLYMAKAAGKDCLVGPEQSGH